MKLCLDEAQRRYCKSIATAAIWPTDIEHRNGISRAKSRRRTKGVERARWPVTGVRDVFLVSIFADDSDRWVRANEIPSDRFVAARLPLYYVDWNSRVFCAIVYCIEIKSRWKKKKKLKHKKKKWPKRKQKCYFSFSKSIIRQYCFSLRNKSDHSKPE